LRSGICKKPETQKPTSRKEKQNIMPLAYIQELTGDRPGHELPGGRPPHVGGGPIIPPPLPGVWPPPGVPTLPIDLPPHASNPIVIPQPPPGVNPPITLPPPGIYPPLPPEEVPTGKVAILVKVIGSDTVHWIVVDTSLHPGTPLPPSPTPK
jgi:hypothetical protein